MKTQLKVIKADGSLEEYLHTKVIGTINNALGRIDQVDICVTEQLADVVTYFLYRKQNRRSVTTNEIFSIVKAVLTTTGYEEAAVALSEYHFERKLKRSRIEVVSIDIRELADAELLAKSDELGLRDRWDKSIIINDLVAELDLPRQTARAITSMVEKKVIDMGITLVPSSLIKQLVLTDTAIVLRAERQLQLV